MPLDDAINPQNVLDDVIRQNAPDLAGGGVVDPKMMMDRLIRRNVYGQKPQAQPKPQEQPGSEFGKYGRDPEGAQDFGAFGRDPEPEQPAPAAQPEKPSGDWSFGEGASVAGRSAGQAAVKAVGSIAKAGALGPELEQQARDQLQPGVSDDYAEVAAPYGKEVKAREREQAAARDRLAEKRSVPIAERPAFKAGQAIQDYAKDWVTPQEQAKYPITSQAAGMVGGAVPVVAAGAVTAPFGGPVGAMGVAGAMMAAQSAGDEFDKAKAAGASDEKAAESAGLSGVIMGATGALPVGVILAPAKQMAPGLVGRMWATLDHAWKSGVTFATVGEAQHFVGEQLAKDYDPNAHYDFDYKRVVAEFLAGSVLGGAHTAVSPRPGEVRPDDRRDDETDTDRDRGRPPGLPPPGEADARRETGPPPGGEPPKPFETELKPKVRSTLEEKAAYYKEYGADDIASWDDERLKAYVNTKSGAGKYASDEEILRRAGHSDDDIGAMSPEEKSAAVDEAKGFGVHAGAEPEEPAREGTRKAPVEPQTAEDVARAASVADQDHTPEQGEANNVQRGHMRWQGLDITIEAPAGGVRRGTSPDGTPFETTHAHPYGYFKGLPAAADGQHPDVIVGEHPTAPTAFVIDEVDPKTGAYRQSKSFVGFQTPQAAIESYLSISSKDHSHLGGMRAFPVDEFVSLAKAGGLTKPVSEAMEARADVDIKVNKAGPEHHEAVAAAVRKTGANPDQVDRVALDLAAELHANGAPPDDAFITAVAKGLIDDGYITPDQVKEAIGDEASRGLLEAGNGAGSEPSAQAPGAAAGRPAAEAKVGGAEVRAQNGAPEAGRPGREDQAGEREAATAAGAANGRGAGNDASGGKRAAAAAEKPAGRQPAVQADGHEGAGRTAQAAVKRVPYAPAVKVRGKVIEGIHHGDAIERAALKFKAPIDDLADEAEEGFVTNDGEFVTKKDAYAQADKEKLIGDAVGSMPEHAVTAADGTKVQVVPVVVEAAHLITSSDQGYDASLQPRQRDRAASQAQIREIATRLDPERLGYSAEADRGAPIVGPDRMVESGNGRVAALRKLYQSKGPNAAKYRDWLKGQGVDVAKYKEPILVRQRATDFTPDQRQGFTVAANQAATLSMSAPERALADAKHLSPRMLGMIEDASNLSAAGNRAFVRSFVAAIPASERGALTNAEGGLSSEGMTRARNAVLAKAYGDADLLARITESTDDDIKSISNALVMAAPQWAKLRADIEAGKVHAELDQTSDLLQAVKQTADIRARGQKLEAYLRQQDAFDQLPAPVETWMRLFYDAHGRRAAGAPSIASSLRFFAEEAAKATTDPKFDLGTPEVTANEIQRAALAKAHGTEAGNGAGAHRDTVGQAAAGSRPGPGRAEAPGNGEPGSVLAEGGDLFGSEPGAEGKPQHVIPGAERVSAAELAKRRAAQPLKPKVAQKQADFGLFGDEGRQADLVDMAAKPVAKPQAAPDILGREAGHERNGRGPDQAVQGRAPGAPAKAPPANAGRFGKRQVPGQLSLFGGEPSPGPVSHGPDATQPGPKGAGNGEPGGQGQDVTKPPSAGGGKRPGNPDRNGPRARPGADGLALAQEKIAERSRLNYRITDDDHVGEGGPKAKARGNLEAIRVLKTIEEEGRQATPEEKAVLVKYTGWGAVAQAMFKDAKRDWAAERDELRALLNDEEYEGARASTPNAHYTSPDVVRGMWDALDHLGYKGGLAIEPSAGIGHFIGLTPDKMLPKTAWTAVELDPISGRIAKALYAGAEVNVHGFEELKRPSNYYDLAISNVPFGDYPVSEKPYGTFSIHDFFFVKSLDKVRPGGMVAFITSRYTLDQVDDNVRQLLGRKADLVGAIRLPGGSKGAFAKNAGTDVTTDILFLRKKIPGETPFAGHDWTALKEIQTPEGPTNINEYFADHPEMMMGEMRLLGTQYRDNEPVLLGPSEGLRERLAEAARAGMPEGALTPRTEPPPALLPASDIEGPVKDGAFFLKDGKLYQKRQGTGVEQKVNADDHDRVRRLVQMRGMVNDMLGAQLAGNKEESAKHRAKLNAAYEAFVRKWGPINKEVRTVTSRLNKQGEPVVIVRRPNFNPFRADPDAFKVAAIENYDPETGKTKPAAALLRDVIDPPKQRQINGPVDALAVSLDETGGIDLNHIADSLGLDKLEDVVKQLGDLIYQNPDGRQWETAEDYLSGNVVKKLEDARTTAVQDKSYERNVKALEKIQPTPLTQAEITAQLGAPWVPQATYEDFFKTGLGATRATVRQVPVTGGWSIKLDGLSRDAQSRYGTDKVSVEQVANAAFNNSSLIVRDRPGPGETTGKVNAAATELARTKVAALQEAFTGDLEAGIEGWAWQDHARSTELEAIYNRTHNNLVAMKLDGSHLTMPGLNPMFLEHKHRMDAVWRMIRRGNTLLAHVVGSGKTVTMIAGGMEMKRLGLINKPAYVVPNHMLEQFSREFLQAYPNAKILVASKEETSRENRREFLAKVSANDWDGVIITHDTFGRINMQQEFRAQYIRDQLAELDRIITAESAGPGGKGSPTVKDLEKAKKRLRVKLDKLLNAERHDEGTSFEESGIDHIFLDEAHKYKNLSFITRMGRVKGLAQGDAQRAEDMFLKIRYLEQKRPGRSAVFATGTPVSNTMAELWTMQRYLQLNTLREHGLDIFDNWANTFGRVVTNAETGPDGRTTRDVSSFSKFVNIPELVSIYAEIADSKTADMLNLKRPIVEAPSGKPGIEIVESELSPEEDAHVQQLVAMLEQLKGKRAKKGEPNVLSHVVTPGRKLATDGRLVGLPFNPNGKIGKAVENIHQIWKDGVEPGTVQMVFMDSGVPKTRGATRYKVQEVGSGWAVIDKNAITDDEDGIIDTFDTEAEAKGHAADAEAEDQRDRIDLHADLKGRLIAKGIPANQIALIHDANTDEKKGKLFAKVRSGELRVLLGTTEKMGVGTNVQDRLIAMHHIDAPWKPAEVEQRDGRIVRQGNKNPKVRILRYVTPRSFDALMWQILERKAAFIAQVTSGTKGIRTAEDIDNPLPEAAEMKAAAAGDVRILEAAELDRKVRQLGAGKRNFEITKQRAGSEQHSARSALARYEKELPSAQNDAAKAQDLRGDAFKVTLGGEEITKRADAGTKILERMLALDTGNFYAPKDVKVGTMSGFDMVLRVQTNYDGDGTYLKGDVQLHGERVYSNTGDITLGKATPPESLIRKFSVTLDGIRAEPARIEKLIATEKDNLARIEKTLAEVWPREKEFSDAKAKLEALKREMKASPEENAYVTQAMANLLGTSRTAQGVVDVSAGGAAKAEKMVEGLTGEQAAANAKANFEKVFRDLYAKRNALPTDGPGMERFIDEIAGRINEDIVKPGELMRQHETKNQQTPVADLAEAHKQFGEELAARLADPSADPIETAAFIEWRANIVDHFWSDGVGKTSKALAAIPLMRAGLPLPKYPSNKEFFSHAPPRGTWDEFNSFYHALVQPETVLSPERVELQALLDQNAPLEDLLTHPAVLNGVAENRKRVPTGTAEDFANPEWRARRVYDFDGDQVTGWDNAVPRLVERAEAYAGGPAAQERRAVVVLGPPAAGKSSTSEPIARAYRAAIADPDDAKLVIQEYHGGLGTAAVHEESSLLSKDALKNLVRDGKNVVLPRVGGNAPATRDLVNTLKDLGYTVDIAHVAATPEISHRRNISRFLQTGRLVDPNYITEVGDKPRETAHILRGEANDFADVDTSQRPAQIQGSGALADLLRNGGDDGAASARGLEGYPGGEAQVLAEGRAPAAWTHHKPELPPRFRPASGAALGKAAQEHVIARGRQTGNEHLVAIDAKGRTVSEESGTSHSIRFSNTLLNKLLDPDNAIVIHHNHPGNKSLSVADISVLGDPGLAALWAHGHGGHVARGALTPMAKAAFRKLMPTEISQRLFTAAQNIENRFYNVLQRFINEDIAPNGLTGKALVDWSNDAYPHLTALTMQRAGVLDYHSNTDLGDLSVFEPMIEQLARVVAGRLLNVQGTIASDTGRAAAVREHPGDVGAVFAGTGEPAGGDRQPARNDRARQASDRKEEAGQLRFPGIAESGPRFTTGTGTPPPGARTAAGGAGAGGPPPPGGTTTAAAAAAPTPARPITGALARTKAARAFKNFWTSTFQPELVSDRAFAADPLFARYKAASTQEKDAIYHASESEWHYWNKRGDAERIRFLDDVETAQFGAVPPDPRQAAMARRYRAMLDANWALEKRFGSQAAFVEDYFPHIWESPDEWRAFSETRSAQVGPTWFQKKRSIDYITDGLAAGLKLKYTNPVDIVVHRLLSGVDMRQRMELLYKLKERGLAWEGTQGGDHLVARGWRAINAPDRKQWVIAPDVQLLWKNAVEAKGFWQAEHVGGSMFRGWMALKNVWVPLKLALSAFHPLHVLHINYSDGMARAWDDVVKGHDPVAAFRSLGQGFFGPMEAAPGASIGAMVGATVGAMTPVGPYYGGLAGSIAGAMAYGAGKRAGLFPEVPHTGKAARRGWVKRPSQQTAEEKAINTLMIEGGFVPQLPEQMKIAAKQQFHESWQKVLRKEAGVREWRRLITASMRRPIEAMQAQVFEEWIPNIKAAAFINEASALLRRRPELLNDEEARLIALRGVGEQVHSRFGEKFYGTMFWNRYLKDAAIGSFLSLGWNYGFVHQFGGAAMQAVTKPLGLTPAFRPSEGRRNRRQSTNALTFALAYLGSAALINGLMTLAYTGDMPHGLDFIFGRIGGENPDGSPRRLSNMFYLREYPMLQKHIQQSNSVFWGTLEMISNKLMFSPFVELLKNRDYYGYNIYDENAPAYQQMWQAFTHTGGEQTNPMSISGAKRAAELSGKPFPSFTEAIADPGKFLESLTAKGVGESVMGFGPAPAYVEKTAIQNRISALYSQHVAPASRPEEEGEVSKEKMSVRTALMLARRNKDSGALQEAYARGRKLGLTQDYMNKVGREPSDLYLFSRLPNSDQKAILRDAKPDEYKRYFPRAHETVRQEIYRKAGVGAATAQ